MCLRRPYLFRLAGKDRGEKGRWNTVGARCGCGSGGIPNFLSLQTHILTLRALWYAPPVTVHQICEQLRLNGCGKNALRLKFARQYEFAGVLWGPMPIAAPTRFFEMCQKFLSSIKIRVQRPEN